VVRVDAMRSVSEKRALGVLVERRRVSRTWEPVGERASVWIGVWCAVIGVREGGKRRAWISFRRKGVLVEVGWSADCRMCVVVG